MAVLEWLNSREIFVATGLIILTLTIGIFGGSLYLSILVATMILGFASGVWAIRAGVEENRRGQQVLNSEVARFRKELGTVSEVLGSMANVQDASVLDSLRTIATNAARVRSNQVLFNVVRRDIAALANELSDRTGRDTYSVRARKTRSELDEFFQATIHSIGAGWTLDEVSNLEFWSRDTLHRPGDLIDANAEAARRGGRIRRILVIPGEHQFHFEEVSILVAMWEMTQRYDNVETLVASPQGHESVGELGTYAVCSPPDDGFPVMVEMHFGSPGTPEEGRFARLEVVSDRDQVARRKSRIERLRPRALPLDTCLRGLLPDLDPDGPLDASLLTSNALLSH